jgi:uncharacterized phage protein (TIGR01671 family)
MEEDPQISLQDCGYGCGVFLFDRKSGDWSNKHCQMKDLTIQQYTGLKDKNGKEIFEGDILSEQSANERDENWRLTTIEWRKAYSGEQWCEVYPNGELSCYYGGISQTAYKEVVGNIYENPEMVR